MRYTYVMDIIATINEKIAEYERRRARTALEDAVKRELTINGGMASAVANVAGLIHGAQNQANAFKQGVYQGTAHLPNMQQAGQGMFGSTHPESDEDRNSRYFLDGFKAKDKDTYDFVTATAQLLSAKIRAASSPNRSPHCTPRHEHIVWQLFNHNWMVDVQWVGDATGGTEDEWTQHFAKLADRISAAREAGEKQWGDEPSPQYATSGFAMSGFAQAQTLGQSVAMAQQANINQQALANQLINTLGLQNASLAGQSSNSSLAGSGGSSSQAATPGCAVGMGP